MRDTAPTQPWSPWRHLREQHPDVTVHEIELRDGCLGCTDHEQRIIWLDSRLTQAERRCTLAHELGHLERGVAPCLRDWQAAEERAVDEWAARRLISIPDLAYGLNWSPHLAEVAEELFVDLPTLRTRMRTLTDEEQDMVWALCHRAWEEIA